MEAVNVLAPEVGLARACVAMRIPRGSVYREDARRRHLLTPVPAAAPRPAPPLALNAVERGTLLEALNSVRFANCAPPTVYATLLDEGIYLGSVRTMYRLLADAGQTSERRAQRIHPANPSCWPPIPTKSGAGTSPSSRGRASGPAFICT